VPQAGAAETSPARRQAAAARRHRAGRRRHALRAVAAACPLTPPLVPRQVVAVTPDVSAIEAMALMNEKHISAVAVVDSVGKIIGGAGGGVRGLGRRRAFGQAGVMAHTQRAAPCSSRCGTSTFQPPHPTPQPPQATSLSARCAPSWRSTLARSRCRWGSSWRWSTAQSLWATAASRWAVRGAVRGAGARALKPRGALVTRGGFVAPSLPPGPRARPRRPAAPTQPRPSRPRAAAPPSPPKQDDGVKSTPGHRFVTDRIARARPRTPGEEVGQSLVLVGPNATFADVVERIVAHRIHRWV
jgi:hypothetical protein